MYCNSFAKISRQNGKKRKSISRRLVLFFAYSGHFLFGFSVLKLFMSLRRGFLISFFLNVSIEKLVYEVPLRCRPWFKNINVWTIFIFRLSSKVTNYFLIHCISWNFYLDGNSYTLRHGSFIIAAITSCKNTSNPSTMLGAGLLARKAVEAGLTLKPYVKTSLPPGL